VRAKFHLDPSNRLATIHQRHTTSRTDRTGFDGWSLTSLFSADTAISETTDRTGQRSDSDSIGQTVLETVVQNSFLHLCRRRRRRHRVKQGRNHWGVGGPGPPKIWTDHPNFFDEECDYRYITYCSARNWVYHTYFVLYNNLDQGIGPQLQERGCALG